MRMKCPLPLSVGNTNPWNATEELLPSRGDGRTVAIPTNFMPQQTFGSPSRTSKESSPMLTVKTATKQGTHICEHPLRPQWIAGRGSGTSHIMELDRLGVSGECILHSQCNNETLTKKLECAQEEVSRMRALLATFESEVVVLKAELGRKRSQIASLSAESEVKDSLLRQLDSAFACVAARWKERDEKYGLELTRMSEAERRAQEKLENIQREFENCKLE
ncbi:unnamed protein product [Dicrocoelium dendriticum]|nr:unnamed protein product [Dicrocoelium dendriticum]